MSISENIMSLRRKITIYECNELYLYEIMEDYKDAASREEKDDIFRSFCAAIWASGNKRKTYTKTIHFKVRKDLADTEIGRIFRQWSDLPYTYYKSKTTDDHWCSVIRQKINNIYTRYFDREVILGETYLDCLKTPKRLYYKWASGTAMDASAVTDAILKAMEEARATKKRLQMEKMTLPWKDYKKIIEGFLYKCFENCRRIEEYEDKSCISTRFNFMLEDHFYGGYINRCLDGEIRKWQKRACGLPQNSRKGYKRCKQCGALIENTGNKKMYCSSCLAQHRLQTYRKYNQKRSATNRNTSFSA